MFDFRLKVFHTVASRLNFTRAAEELYITQPAVTKHIHEIENYFKVKLFDRNGTRIKLTPAGQVLFQHTTQLFAIYSNLEFDLNTLSERHSGQLNIGASTTVAQYVLPPVLASFHAKFQDIRVAMKIDNTGETENALQERSIDLGVIEGRTKNALFKYTEFVKDKLVLVADARHPLAKKATLKPEELTKIPLLLREPGSGTLEVLAHALKPLGIKIGQLRNEMQLGSTESMKAYIQHSDCLAFMSAHAVTKEVANQELAVIDVKGLVIERFFYFIQLHGQAEALPDLFIRFAKRPV